ncbi:Holliday junction branch migration protein RuvA [Aquibacillus koreensis]|uniref:Holliday junction branch migration complex subunit RuvA n=1 Tax=Aquibacillus koreensis TaxID=279446 RepID=A0A9X3WFZ5_9BACI|nr:Holliday junction branch migration protein RuvA [Aquibacillus koreensis]MCT2537982.1 Holliday junction branch migration protein RuvA [Aquibacillus koreensis]MDC3419127.1 Holliday junction branch migration protein RuvA [Aquibacillus koreensis]
MIAYIKGKLELINEQAVVVEANGVGYEIICANPFAFQDNIGENVLIYTYHHVREDAQILYGFKKSEEKVLFSKILNVSGIGPKGALSILGTSDVQGFVVAIEEEDEKFLTSFPGVGKKTARQMILDLKGKLPVLFNVTNFEGSNEQNLFKQDANPQALEEASEALKSLGYSDREIKSILPALKKETDANADELIRKGLALMMQK